MSAGGEREPRGSGGRLTFVHRLIAVFAVVMMVGAGASPAVAQSDPATQSGPTLEATIGLGGFVASGRPTSVSATVSTPVLLGGRLRVRGNGVAVSRPIEVPAGSRQSFEMAMPPLSDSSRVIVEVLDAEDQVILSESVTVRSALDEMAVGVVGDESLMGTLGRVRTIVTDRPVAPFPVPVDISQAVLDVVEYLLVAPGGADILSQAMEWTAGGGRLVVDQSIVSQLQLDTTPLPTGVEGVTTARVGAGRVIVVEGVSGRSGEDWAAILRPAPLDVASSPEFGAPEQGGLIQAASEAGNRQVPSLPWLLFAILGFAVVVGPLNFIVLSRLGKRDWAWVTIPTMAVIAVAAFWVAGRQRIAGTNLSHASFIIEDGAVEARSAVLIAAGVAGEREVSFDADASIYPEAAAFGASSAELRIVGENTAQVNLDQLGFTGVGVRHRGPSLELPATSLDSGSVTVSNDTEMSFWAWGVMRGGAVSVGQAALEPGTRDEMTLPGNQNAGFGFGFVDAVVNQRQLWEDPQRSNSLWPLSQVLMTSIDPSGTYLVALTDDYRPTVGVDGTSTSVQGVTMLVVRVGGGDAPREGRATSVGAEVVGTGFINWADWGNQRMISTDELTVGFSLPDPGLEARFRDSQNIGVPPSRYEAWNWSEGKFAEIQRNEPLAPEAISPDGQVYVRLVGEEFGENPFSPDSLSLEWDA